MVRKLLEYKKFKEAADQLHQMRNEHKNVFLRRGAGEKEKIVADDGTEYFEASLFDLITAFKKVLTEIPKEIFHTVIKSEFSVSDKIHDIYHMLAKESTLQFSKLFAKTKTKDEAIATFLAVLELMKMHEIMIVQKDLFSDIEIMRNPDLIKKEPGVTENS